MKKLSLFLALVLSLVFVAPPSQAAFSDVPSSHNYGDAINYVKDQGIVQGYSDGTYRPENTINRAEFTKILIEAFFEPSEIDTCLSADQSLFTDVNSSDWFAPYVCVAKKFFIIEGYPDGSFGPAREINFAEAAKIIVITSLPEPGPAGPGEEWFTPYLKALESLDAVPGSIEASWNILNRGEMAALIYYIQTPASASQTITGPVTKTTTPVSTTEEPWDCISDAHTQLRVDVINLVNIERSALGLKPLTLNCLLEKSSQAHSDDMRAQGYFSHSSLDGRSEQDRIEATGYLQPFHDCACGKSYTAGENIAKGQSDAAEVMEHWMNSPAHRDNILSPDYSEIGIGVTAVDPNEEGFIGFFWVQNFGDISLNL